jgi:hypothetical protein
MASFGGSGFSTTKPGRGTFVHVAAVFILIGFFQSGNQEPFPWRIGDPPPSPHGIHLGERLAVVDSVLGAPTARWSPQPGKESRRYAEKGLTIVADSAAGIEYLLLSSRQAGDLGGIRVGDSRERVKELFGAPTLGRGETTRYTLGEWTIQVQLDPMNEFVENLSLGRTTLFPPDELGFLATVKSVTRDLYEAGESVGLLSFLSVANFLLWRKYRFWLPWYVHALAAISLIVIGYLNWMWIQIGGELTVRRVIIILFFPVIVYTFFIGAGGVKAALSRSGAA